MKRFTMFLATVLGIVILQFATPSTVMADTIQSSLSLLQNIPPTVMIEAQADVTNQSAPKKSWGEWKAMYRGNTALPYTADRAQESADQFRKPDVQSMSLSNQSTGILWPFGPNENPANWRGVSGTRTGGDPSPYFCEGNVRGTHAGADYYSRDLSRVSGSSQYTPIYAGRNSYVLSIRQGSNTDCYGNSVILWDPSTNVEIRYSHLWAVSSWITQGMWITQGKFIGWVGNSSCSKQVFSPHLHLTTYKL